MGRKSTKDCNLCHQSYFVLLNTTLNVMFSVVLFDTLSVNNPMKENNIKLCTLKH